jgi:hypothetical protein
LGAFQVEECDRLLSEWRAVIIDPRASLEAKRNAWRALDVWLDARIHAMKERDREKVTT